MSDSYRVVVDERLPSEDALELRDHLREHASEIGVNPEVIRVEDFSQRTKREKFYVLCAMGTWVVTCMVFFTGGTSWYNGFATGFGLASVFALLFLTVQERVIRVE